MKEKLKELLEKLREKNSADYNKVKEIIYGLKTERVKLIGNDLRQALGRPRNEAETKEKIVSAVESLNIIAKRNGVDVEFSENFDLIEKFLRTTIMEDLGKEFENQKNQ